MMYEVRIDNVKANEVNDALNCAVNRLFEGSTATVTTTFRNDAVSKIIGAEFKTHDDFINKGTVVGYVLTKHGFSHINEATFTFNRDVPKCILGKDIQVTECKMCFVNIVQMDLDFTYMGAMVGDTPAMDSPLWDAFMSTYFAIRKKTDAYVARNSNGMRWTSVCTSDTMTNTVIDAYNTVAKMYASKYNVKVAEAIDDVDIIFDHRLFWEEDDDED